MEERLTSFAFGKIPNCKTFSSSISGIRVRLIPESNFIIFLSGNTKKVKGNECVDV